MGRPTFAGILLAISGLMVPISLAAAVDLPLETYKPRDVVVARYGSREGEFGLKCHDGLCLGALFFSVGADGTIYIYDGVKENIKVYGKRGAFLKTIKGVPNQDDLLLIDDMTVVPSGNIYILCEISEQDDKYRRQDSGYRVFVTAAGADTVTRVPASVNFRFSRLTNGERPYNAAEIVSDQTGSVYLKGCIYEESIKLVDKEEVLSDSAQSASWKWDRLSSSEPSLGYPGRNGKMEMAREPVLMHKTDRRILGLVGGEYPLGTDSLGNGYSKNWVDTGSAVSTRITKYSAPRRVLAVVDSPIPGNLTRTYGKGRWIVATDGSLYELISTTESVRLRKWERVK